MGDARIPFYNKNADSVLNLPLDKFRLNHVDKKGIRPP